MISGREVTGSNPDLVKRLLSHPVAGWVAQFCEFEEPYPTPEFHLDIYELMIKHFRMLVKAPRSFSKSTVCAKNFPLYLACNYKQLKEATSPAVYPHNRVLIGSETATLSKDHLLYVRNQLENNELILEEYGDLTGPKWGEMFIETRDGFQIRVGGAGMQWRGFRPSLFIGDDLEGDEEVLSEERRQKKRDWFDKAVINMLDKARAQAFVIGTTLHPLCLLNHIEQKEGWESRTYKAFNPDGTALWPSKWPVERLEHRRREIGVRNFNSEFMNEAAIQENPIFEKNWFQYYERNSQTFRQTMHQGLYIVTAVDPAIGKDETADYTAIVTKGATFDNPPKIFTLEVKRQKGWTVRDTVREIFLTFNKWHQKYTIVETVAFQKAIADEVRFEEKTRRQHVGLVEFIPDKDKERRAHVVAPMYQNGQEYIDTSDPMQMRMMEEMLMFPTGDHDDLVDASVMCDTEIKTWSSSKGTKILSAVGETW